MSRRNRGRNQYDPSQYQQRLQHFQGQHVDPSPVPNLDPNVLQNQRAMMEAHVKNHIQSIASSLYVRYLPRELLSANDNEQEAFAVKCLDAAMSFVRPTLGIDVRREVRRPVKVFDESQPHTIPIQQKQ